MPTDHEAQSPTDALARQLAGRVLGPHDLGYAEACAAWNLAWVHRPAVVVHAASESDVAAAVTHARRHGLSVAVQATGHGVATPADEGSLLLVLSGLDGVRIDPGNGTATIGGGCTWAPVLAAAAEHGLAPLLGSAPHVGAVGYSLGGGFGWLGRKHGLAVDSIRSLRVVLADGRTVTASATEHPELFWALCGAGPGSLGVVAEMTTALVPVTDVYAGSLLYPVDVARELFPRYLEWAEGNPEELTSSFSIMAFPPLDVVPEPVRGRTFAIIRGCHAGDPAEGEHRVDQWRSWRAPTIDTWGPLPVARLAEVSQDPVDPVPAAGSGRWLQDADEDVLELMLEAMAGMDRPSPLLLAELRHAGGAIATPNDAVSYGARAGRWSLALIGMVLDEAAGNEIERRFTAAWDRAARLFPPQPGVLNFTEGRERVEVAAQSFTVDARRRLARVKQEYDPTDVFRHGVALDTV